MKRYLLLSLLIVASLSTELRAQGSVYDLIGFGTPVPSRNPAIEAMGGSGTALLGSRTINDMNPADWTSIARARFETSFGFHYADDQQGLSQTVSTNVQFQGFSFAVPFWSDYQATIGIGYIPLTNASARLMQNDSMASQVFLSKGGVNVGFLGAAIRPVPALAVGARLDLVLGNIRHVDQVAFNDANAEAGQFERDYIFHALRPTLGLEVIGDSISGLNGFTLGASFSPGVQLSSTNSTIITPLSTTLDTTIDATGYGYYPNSLNVGLSWHSAGRFMIEGDYLSQNYSKAFLYSTDANATDPTLRNSTRMSLGITRAPNMAGEYGTSFGIDQWALRLGAYFYQLPFQPAGTGGINELAGTAGVGVPISFESMINISAVLGSRQPVNAGTAPKELFFRLGVSLSLSDRWFVPMRRDE